MARAQVASDREHLHVMILRAQMLQVDKFCEAYNRTKTEIIEEALQLWINEQIRLYGEKLGV